MQQQQRPQLIPWCALKLRGLLKLSRVEAEGPAPSLAEGNACRGTSFELSVDVTPRSPGNEHLGYITASTAINLIFIWRGNLPAFLRLYLGLLQEAARHHGLKAGLWDWFKSCSR